MGTRGEIDFYFPEIPEIILKRCTRRGVRATGNPKII